jgi:hypothetical protein
MPAFSFEKISPPAGQASAASSDKKPVENKQPGVIGLILGRFVETRVLRVQRVEKSIFGRRRDANK